MSDIVIGQRLAEVQKIWNEGTKHELFGYLLRGKAIDMLKKGKLYIMDAAGIPSFRYYVTHELKISVAEAHRLAQIYRLAGSVLEKNNVRIGVSALTLLLPYLKDKTDEEKLSLIEMNKDIPLEAVKNNILDLRGKGELATDVCMHEDGWEIYKKCKKCRKFFLEE